MTVKQQALKVIEDLPDQASLADIVSALKNISNEQKTIRAALVSKDSKVGDKPLSCFDLVRDLAGTVEAESDLSTDKRHMDDYGK